jgi:hypothetical protein
MVLYPFCDPYVWENPKVLLSTSLIPRVNKAGPCASHFTNQIVLVYSLTLLFASIATIFIQSPFIVPLCIGFATLFTLPSLWNLVLLQTMREGFSDAQSGKIQGLQVAVRDTKEKIDFLTSSLSSTTMNDAETNNVKKQIAQLTASMTSLTDSIANLQDYAADKVTGSVGSAPSVKAERLPLSQAREVYDVIGKGAAPANLMLPTAKNPFMNVLIDEIMYNPTRPLAASVLDPSVKVTLEEFFRTDFYSDPTDVFGKTQSQRQFVAMPSTSIPNDVDSYQNWLYRIPGKTCKEGGREACLPGTDGGAVTWLNANP